MQIPTIEEFVKHVQEAGQMAFEEQKKGRIDRRYKIDGSVIITN